jgi:CHRD domain
MHRRRPLAIAGAALAAGALAAVPIIPALGAHSNAVTRGPLFASMTGGNEAPTKGDRDGSGAATFLFPSPTKVCFALLVNNLKKPNAAHIHRGAKGVAGPIVVPLTPPASGTAGFSSGCATASAAVISEIASKPASFYVNVHTTDFPGGAIRGQLHK